MRFVLTLLLAPPTFAQISYTPVDIGTLGGDDTFANGLSGNGYVVGRSEDASGTLHGFFWDGALMQPVVDTQGTTPGGLDVYPQVVNSAGQVACIVLDGAGGVERTYLWTVGGDFTLLPALLDNTQQAVPTGIDESGVVVGNSLGVGPCPVLRATAWFSTAPTDLLNSFFPIAGCLGPGNTRTVDVSPSGVMTGYYYVDGGFPTHWPWARDPSGAVQHVSPYPTPGNGSDFCDHARDASSDGWVLVQREHNGGQNSPVRVELVNPSLDPGVRYSVMPYSSPDADRRRAIGMNEELLVYGEYGFYQSNGAWVPTQAELILPDVRLRFDSLIPAGSGIDLTRARDVNDAGVVLCRGTQGGNTRGFVLVPDADSVAITLNPSDKTVDEGAEVRFFGRAAGPNVSYQWLHDGVELVDGPGVSGAQSASLTLSSASAMDMGYYALRAVSGSRSATSQAARLLVLCGALAIEDWEQLQGQGPTHGKNGASAYDAAREVLVLFGGFDGQTTTNETWEFGTGGWSLVSTTGPPARQAAGMAYDPNGGVSVLHGGTTPGGTLADTWEWNGAGWQMVGSGPLRHSAGIAFDSASQTVLLHGGSEVWPVPFGDTWSFANGSWTQLATNSPTARTALAMAAIPNGPVVLFGGWSNVGGWPAAVLGDTWELSGGQWIQRSTGTAHYSCKMTWDGDTGRLVLSGGEGIGTNHDRIYFYDETGGTWTEQSLRLPYGVRGHTFEYFPPTQQLIFLGGQLVSNGQHLDETWTLCVLPSFPNDLLLEQAIESSALTLDFAELDGLHDGLTYQWLKSGVALVDDGRIAGADSPTLSIDPAQPGDEGFYSLRITNPCGEVCSNPIEVTFDCLSSVGTAFCGCSADAPCGNTGEAGCASGAGPGASLSGCGSPSVTADDLYLITEQLPADAFGLIFMGDAAMSRVPFGNGLRCVDGSMLYRFPVRNAGSDGRVQEGPIVGETIALFPPQAHIQPGSSWNFQFWFRDPGGPCGASFNLSNALAVDFEP